MGGKFAVYASMAILSVFLPVGPGQASEKMTVFVSIIPQKYFVQQIGMDLVDVHVMVSPGASPHTYEPKPSQMAALSRATLYFAIGVPFEDTWLSRISAANPHLKIIHTDEGIPKISMVSHDPDEETHYDGDDHGADHHHHGGHDPHIWLSPPLVMTQARIIADALQKADPDNREVYRKNYGQFHAGLVDLHEELTRILAPGRGKRFMVFHPSWGYFAKTYQLEQIPIEVEGKDPKPARLKHLITYARENHIDIVFVQPQFSSKSAALIAREINGVVTEADPLAENWDENLKILAEKFNEAAK